MPTQIDRTELQGLLSDEQAQLVDVLSPDEFEEDRLPGATNIPLKQLDRETTRQLDRARPVVVYCHDYQ